MFRGQQVKIKGESFFFYFQLSVCFRWEMTILNNDDGGKSSGIVDLLMGNNGNFLDDCFPRCKFFMPRDIGHLGT